MHASIKRFNNISILVCAFVVALLGVTTVKADTRSACHTPDCPYFVMNINKGAPSTYNVGEPINVTGSVSGNYPTGVYEIAKIWVQLDGGSRQLLVGGWTYPAPTNGSVTYMETLSIGNHTVTGWLELIGPGGDINYYGWPWNFPFTVVASTPPNTPTNLMVVKGSCGTGLLGLSWDTVPGATYKIYRDGASIPVGTSVTNSYSDSGLTAGQQYQYSVSAVVSGVESATTTPPVVQIAPSSCFDYSLSNPGTIVQLELGAAKQVPITVHKLSGADSDVAMTLAISGTHTGTSGSLSPTTVHLTTTDAISQATIGALSSALAGTFTVTVSGSATDENGVAVLRSTAFQVEVGNVTSGGIGGACSSSVDSNGLVTLTAIPTGQSGTVTYVWYTGVGTFTSGASTYSYSPPAGTYSTRVEVSDSDGHSGSLDCGTVVVPNTPLVASNAVELWFHDRAKPTTPSAMDNQAPVNVSVGTSVPLDFTWDPASMICHGDLVSGPESPANWNTLGGVTTGSGTYPFSESNPGAYELRIICQDASVSPAQTKVSNKVKIIVTKSSSQEL